jgi:hypothetical protein
MQGEKAVGSGSHTVAVTDESQRVEGQVLGDLSIEVVVQEHRLRWAASHPHLYAGQNGSTYGSYFPPRQLSETQ